MRTCLSGAGERVSSGLRSFEKAQFSSTFRQTDVLVSPLRRSAVRLGDLTNDELIDLMSVVERGQSAVEKEYNAQDSTISLQVVLRREVGSPMPVFGTSSMIHLNFAGWSPRGTKR